MLWHLQTQLEGELLFGLNDAGGVAVPTLCVSS